MSGPNTLPATGGVSDAMPELPPIPVGMQIPYESIRYIAGYATNFVQQYAIDYAKLCLAQSRQPSAQGSGVVEIKAAFEEGYAFGHSDGMEDCRPMGGSGYGLESCWEDSDTRKRSLAQPPATGGGKEALSDAEKYRQLVEIYGADAIDNALRAGRKGGA